MPSNIPEYKPNLVPTKFSFINFKEKEDAKNALINSKYNASVIALFDDPKNLYITYHVKKSKMNSLHQIKYRQMMPGMMGGNMMGPMNPV